MSKLKITIVLGYVLLNVIAIKRVLDKLDELNVGIPETMETMESLETLMLFNMRNEIQREIDDEFVEIVEGLDEE
jgi:hypothetical protein